MTTLFERLGGTEGITAIADTLVELHMKNPTIAARYTDSDVPAVKRGAATFFIAGTGGPSVYAGKDMRTAHRGMNIGADEFMAVLDDALAALVAQGIGRREQEEVLYVLYGMRGDIVRV